LCFEELQGKNVRDEHEANHEDTALAELISVPAGSDAEQAGDEVGRDGKKLRLLRSLGDTELIDDGGQEERVGVEGSVDEDGDEHVAVDLPVLERLPEVLHVELIGERRTVALEAGLDLLALLRSQELGGSRVVLHDDVGDNG